MTRLTMCLRFTCAVAIAACASVAHADDKAAYETRAAARFTELFQTLDRDRDGRVTLEEAAGDLNFVPSFDNMDINRDGAVTIEELRRFLELKFGAGALPAAGVPEQSR